MTFLLKTSLILKEHCLPNELNNLKESDANVQTRMLVRILKALTVHAAVRADIVYNVQNLIPCLRHALQNQVGTLC